MNHDEQLQNIETGLQHLLNGENDKVSDGSCHLTSLIKQLADLNSSRIIKNLTQTVDMSVIANKGVSGVAEMLSEINQIDNQSQSIAAAVEELSASVGNISQTANDAASEVSRVSESATIGLDAAKKAQLSMDEIAHSVQESASKVDDLSVASEEIGIIVKDIEAIAKQTNLLALNATIEAARAGDAGRGFAVVANEVKNLASQTAVATDTIRTRITNLQTEMDAIITAMQQGNDKASQGREVIQASTEEMKNISVQVDVVNDRMQEINGILEQQTEAAQEVSEGVSTIARMSTSNVSKVNNVIEVLEATESPIIDGVNDLVSRAGKTGTLFAAKSDHMIWMRKLSQMLAGRGTLNPKELADHHSCRLGKWYDGQKDAAFTSLPEWKAILAPHKTVHSQGIEAAKLYAEGNIDGAITAINLADKASKEVMDLLSRMIDKLTPSGA